MQKITTPQTHFSDRKVLFRELQPCTAYRNVVRSIWPVLLFFFLLSSCGTSYSSQEADPYRTGTEGVVLSFLDDDYVFYDQQYLNLQLVLENKGAYDEPQGKVVLSGYDPTIVKLDTEPIELPDEFYGKNIYAPEGSQYFVSVAEEAPVSLSLGESYETTLQASLCYSYRSIATPTVCLLYNPEDTYICDQDTIGLSSQGGPVAVTEVRQDYEQDKVRFTVFVQHVGDGTVVNAYDVAAYDACPFGLTNDDLDHVGISLEINGLNEPSCIPSNGYIALNDAGQGVIICTFTLHEQRTYTTPLKITLDYSYLSIVDQDIGIYESSSDREAYDQGYDSSESESSSDCDCSEANLNKWGGCVCLYVGGKMYYCSEGQTEIKISAAADEFVEYQVHGSSTVTKCGDSSNPTSSCPFTGTTLPKKLSIYGTVSDGRTVSERCNIIAS